MKSLLLFGIVFLMGHLSYSQQLTIAELGDMLDLPANKIDSLMKKKGYRLIQKEIDSVSNLHYYASLEMSDDDNPNWIRSVSYMDVKVKNVQSRMVTYRTYKGEEYQQSLAWLLANDYKTTHRFDFKGSKQTIYERGKESVRVKVSDQKLPNGKPVKAYEFELGK